jgi:hypothetical protein
VISCAQARSSLAAAGSQTNSFARLAVRDTPDGSNGPLMSIPPMSRGTRICPRKLKPPYGVNPSMGSSVDARERSMNVTTTSWTPAAICTGMPAKRCMISARAGAPP